MADEIRVLTQRDLFLAYEALYEVFRDDPEPVAPWEQGEPSKIATIAGCTEVAAFGVAKYPDISSKAAKLFYSAIKIHPFPNGNKRFAFVLTIGFLALNDLRLTAPQGVGADEAKRVALSDPHTPEGQPDLMIDQLKRFFEENVEPYDWLADADAEAENG